MADVRHDLLAIALGRLQVDVDLGRVHALRVLVEFGAAGAPADLPHFRNFADQALGQPADLVGLLQRGARVEHQRQDQ
jgi:hypothetical protein